MSEINDGKGAMLTWIKIMIEDSLIIAAGSVTELTPQDDATWHTSAAVCALQTPAARQHAQLSVRPSIDQHVHRVDSQGRTVPPESAEIPSL